MEILYIIIPAYNEEANIETVAREWHEIVRKVSSDSRLVIIDDGSKDHTFSKLQDLKNQLSQLKIITKQNSGHGSTVLYGYKYALASNADFIFQTDSDGQTIPDEFWEFWKERKTFNIQIGCRKGRQDGIQRVFVTKVLKYIILMIFGIYVQDANAPFRLMDKNSLNKHIKKVPDDYHLCNVLLSIIYEKEKSAIKYIPITFRPRQGGKNSINMRNIFNIGKKSIKEFIILKKIVKN